MMEREAKNSIRAIAVLLVWVSLGRCADIAHPVGLLADARDGLTVNKSRAFRGYTLIAPMNSTSTYLIDMDGRIVNEWKSDFTPGLSAYLLENGHLLRPGFERDLGHVGAGTGGRIQEFTWAGELVWDYSFGKSQLRPHHDICRLPNGNVLVIASDTKAANVAIAAGRRPTSLRNQLISECVLEIKPTGRTTGEIVWKWCAWDHLIQDFDRSKPNFGDVSEHPELIDLNFSTSIADRMMNDPQQLARLRSLGYVAAGTPAIQNGATLDSKPPASTTMDGDWLHMNSVAYNAQLDQIMLSIHDFSEVWIIDHGTTTAEAASHKGGHRGHGGDLLYRWGNPRVYRCGSNVDQRLFVQHCAHWIDEGRPGANHMLVFNNGVGRPDGAYSSIEEVALPLNAIGLYDKEEYVAFPPLNATWTYCAPQKTDFLSILISGAQRLPNGNTLVCSGNQRLLFEVTPENEIVWQFKYSGNDFGTTPPMNLMVPAFFHQVLDITEDQLVKLRGLQAQVNSKLFNMMTEEQWKILQKPFRINAAKGDQSSQGQGRFRPRHVGDVIPDGVVEELKLSEWQAIELKQIQRFADEQLAQIWREDQRERVAEMKAAVSGIPHKPANTEAPPPAPAPSPVTPSPPDTTPKPESPENQLRPDRRTRGGHGGIFRSYRYGVDYPGITGKDLKPGKLLVDPPSHSDEKSP